jgi:hypothetical protein
MSDKPTITKMNEAIAIFDGWELVRIGYFDTTDETDWQIENDKWIEEVGIEDVGHYIVKVKENTWHQWEDVAYHTSWDWLMPVVRKIYGTLQQALKARPPHTCTNGDLIEVDIGCAIRECDIEKTHEYVYNFIQWYNKTQTNGE